jgi:dTDP-4-amino-4,6-dideoxygalactose transaminase
MHKLEEVMTFTSRTDAATRLALLGGTPVRTPETRQYPVWSEDAKRHVARLLDEGVALGLSKHSPEIEQIEAALEEFFGVPRALGTSTGNGALHAALIGLELTAGDEVMTSPYTYGVTISCILHNNCIPTFADVVEGTGLMDPASVRERITERTRALLVPHIFGNPADMTALMEIAREHDLKVIEDGSQAHGAKHRGRRIGAFGDAGGFSANGVKPIAATEAGFLLTQHEDVYWKAVVSTQHAGMGEYPGRSTEPTFPEELRSAIDSLVYTFRLTPLNAALMLDRLRRVDVDNDVRRRHLELLREGLAELGGVSVPELLFEGDESSNHQAIVRFDAEAAGVSKQTYMEAVNAEGLYCYVYLPRPVNRAPRLSPDWSGTRVMWTENLKRANYDATKVELPVVERQITNHFNLIWNYIDYDPAFIGEMIDVFAKVDENLEALRAYERERQSS